MKYVVQKGYSYVDINGRQRVYTSGEEFDGVIDPTQNWKLGRIDQATPQEIATKVIERSKIKKPLKVDEPYHDPDDEGEETE